MESLRASADENSVLMGAESESIFLVYLCVLCVVRKIYVSNSSFSFFFTLQEFAKELISLVDAMSRICNIQRETGWRKILRPWNYMRTKIRRMRQTASEKRRSRLHKTFCELLA